MILRRISNHVKEQNWTAVGIDLLIVVVGVFLGIQLGNWNADRLDRQRQERIVEALETNLRDATGVQERFVAEIDAGLAAWDEAAARGERPVPFVYRIEGSDTAPDTWSTFEQMGLADLFDPVTLFDLTLYHSELAGISQKYVRYVTFVEDEVLPGEIAGAETFYAPGGRLKPEFQANMDRLRDYRQETRGMIQWAECLAHRLNAERTFEQSCRRADYHLDGMDRPTPEAEVSP